MCEQKELQRNGHKKKVTILHPLQPSKRERERERNSISIRVSKILLSVPMDTSPHTVNAFQKSTLCTCFCVCCVYVFALKPRFNLPFSSLLKPSCTFAAAAAAMLVFCFCIIWLIVFLFRFLSIFVHLFPSSIFTSFASFVCLL